MIRDLSRNLKARNLNTDKVRVTADEMVLEDNAGTPRRVAPVDVTIDINVSGSNGLDTGIKSAGTWYHIWVISGPHAPAEGLLSASASNPTLPAGYTFKAYVGAIYNNSGNQFALYLQNDKLVWAATTYPLAMSAFPLAPTSVDLSASVPSTAISVTIELSGLTTIGGHFVSSVFVGPTSLGPWHNGYMLVAPAAQGSVDHVQFITQNEILLDSPQQIFAYTQTTDNRLQIAVLGWRY